MKKSSFKITLGLAVASMALGLASCGGKTLTATAYAVNSSSRSENAVIVDGKTWTANAYTDGDGIFKVSVEVNKGVVTNATYEEYFSYSRWARVSPAEAIAHPNDVIMVPNVYTMDPATSSSPLIPGELFYAKHIKIGDYMFTGTLRDAEEDSALIQRGMFINYHWDDMASKTSEENSSTYPYDLDDYLVVTETTTYKLGARAQWYFEALEKGQVTLYGDKDGKADTSRTYPLSLPTSGVAKTKSTDYTAWKSGCDALMTYLKGHKLSFVYSVDGGSYKTIRVEDGTYRYNPLLTLNTTTDYAKADETGWEDTGVRRNAFTSDALRVYMTSATAAFGSVEYESYR